MSIEQTKSNQKEIFKDKIREIIKEELCDLEKASSAVNLLQKHMDFLMESNTALRKKIVLNLSFSLTILRSIAVEHVLQALTCLVKKRKQVKKHQKNEKIN